MKKRLMYLCLVIMSFYLGGCASIVSSSSRNVTITSEPDQAKVEIIDIKDNNTSILKASTPHTLNMDASAGFFQSAAFKIKLSKDGYLPAEKELKANINGWYFGNIVFGGLLGILIVDPATGAMWKFYDDKVHVKLYQDSPEGRISMAREVYSGIEPMEAQDYEQVVEDTSKAISLYPEYMDAYMRRSIAYENLGEQQKAQLDIQRINELQPKDAKEYQARGDFFVGKKLTEKALADFNKALELAPNQLESLFSRGLLYAQNKNTDKAKQDISTACKQGYSRACNFVF
mgnify:CR=1 FL=1